MLVIIVHPEQWNGGSDRCVIGVIRHFVNSGHKVIWYTTMIDKYWQNESFSGVEIRNINLALHPGDWFSQNVALGFTLLLSHPEPDLIMIDHSASCVPLLKWRFPTVKILFYCHFPQQLVMPSRFFLYRWYSKLISLLEGTMFNYVDLIMVNSHFTKGHFLRVMPEINSSKLMVVYPPCDVDAISVGHQAKSRFARPPNTRYTFLSINRFWPEKRLDIIVEAAVILKRKNYKPRILLAGSVMPHIPESRIYYGILREMVAKFDVSDIVEFLDSPTDSEKFRLYAECDTVIYTPPDEHFGIVPVEALEQRRPVIVCNSGGPAETVIEGITGTKIDILCGALIAKAMEEHILTDSWPELDDDKKYAHQRDRFERNFSLRGFCRHIDVAVSILFPHLQSNKESISRRYA